MLTIIVLLMVFATGFKSLLPLLIITIPIDFVLGAIANQEDDVILHADRGIDVSRPNLETQEAMHDLEQGKVHRASNREELITQLNNDQAMNDSERLEKYRLFILDMNRWMMEGNVKVSSCRVQFGCDFERLVRDATLWRNKQPLDDEIGRGIKMTEEEKQRLTEKIEGGKNDGEE